MLKGMREKKIARRREHSLKPSSTIVRVAEICVLVSVDASLVPLTWAMLMTLWAALNKHDSAGQTAEQSVDRTVVAFYCVLQRVLPEE